MAEVRRPLSLQLGASPATPSSTKSPLRTPTAIGTSKMTPLRPQTITASSCGRATNATKSKMSETPRQQLATSSSSGSISSFNSSSVSTTSSSSSSTSSTSFSPRTSSPSINCPTDTPDSPSLILPYLYVGDQAQTQIDTISSLNISYILSLQSLPKFLDSDVELEETSYESNQPEMNPSSNNEASTSTQAVGSPTTTSTQNVPPHVSPISGRVNGGESQLILPSTSTKAADNANHDDQHQVASTSQAEAQSSKMAVDGEGCKQITSETVASELLPSMNSSKDYLVKFRSCVNRLIKGKCINVSDTFEQYVEKFFDETHNFIEEARRNKCNILVHCKAGISRSPTIAIAYLMKWKSLHLQDAYDFVKRCRPQISPNLNFMGQLMSYERRLLQRGLHKASFLPSPTTSHCLLSPSFHEQSEQATFPHNQQGPSGNEAARTSEN